MADTRGSGAERGMLLLIAATTLGMAVLTTFVMWRLGAVTALSGAFVVVALGALAMQITRTGRPAVAGVVMSVVVVLGLCTSGLGHCAAELTAPSVDAVALERVMGPDGVAYLRHPRLGFLVPDLGEDFVDDSVRRSAGRGVVGLLGESAETWALVDPHGIEVTIYTFLVRGERHPEAFTLGVFEQMARANLRDPVLDPTYDVTVDGVHELWISGREAAGDQASAVHALLYDDGGRMRVVALQIDGHVDDDWTPSLACMHAAAHAWHGPHACPEGYCGDAVDLGTARAAYHDRPPLDVEPPGEPLPPDAEGVFDVVHYAAELGDTCAYATRAVPDAPTGAALYLHGGFSLDGDIDAGSPARQLADAGLVVLAPCMRGEHDAPGDLQLLFGELEDARAALDHLLHMPGVDPARTVVIGHSIGATTTMQLAELGAPATAFYAFGPLTESIDLAFSGDWFDVPPYETRDPRARWIRAPIHFMSGIEAPTYVMEGYGGNGWAAEAFRAVAGTNGHVRVIVAEGDHGSLLAPVLAYLAPRISRGEPPPSVADIVRGAELEVVEPGDREVGF